MLVQTFKVHFNNNGGRYIFLTYFTFIKSKPFHYTFDPLLDLIYFQILTRREKPTFHRENMRDKATAAHSSSLYPTTFTVIRLYIHKNMAVSLALVCIASSSRDIYFSHDQHLFSIYQVALCEYWSSTAMSLKTGGYRRMPV